MFIQPANAKPFVHDFTRFTTAGYIHVSLAVTASCLEPWHALDRGLLRKMFYQCRDFA